MNAEELLKKTYPEIELDDKWDYLKQRFSADDMLRFTEEFFKTKIKHSLNINLCGQLIKSMPIDQAIQVMKSEITGLPETQVIDGDLVVILVK